MSSKVTACPKTFIYLIGTSFMQRRSDPNPNSSFSTILLSTQNSLARLLGCTNGKKVAEAGAKVFLVSI
jgi:hypothetical protein